MNGNTLDSHQGKKTGETGGNKSSSKKREVRDGEFEKSPETSLHNPPASWMWELHPNRRESDKIRLRWRKQSSCEEKELPWQSTETFLAEIPLLSFTSTQMMLPEKRGQRGPSQTFPPEVITAPGWISGSFL